MTQLRIEQDERLSDVLRAGSSQIIPAVVGAEVIAPLCLRIGHAAQRQSARGGSPRRWRGPGAGAGGESERETAAEQDRPQHGVSVA